MKRLSQGSNNYSPHRNGFNALMSLALAIERVRDDIEKVKQSLYSESLPATSETVRFDSFGDIEGLNFALKSIRSGIPHPLP